jgi:hypothetical protein
LKTQKKGIFNFGVNGKRITHKRSKINVVLQLICFYQPSVFLNGTILTLNRISLVSDHRKQLNYDFHGLS